MSILQKYASAAGQNAERTLKGDAREVVRAYRHVWDVYAELLQNAVDAINRRFRLCHAPNFYDYDDFRKRHPDVDLGEFSEGRIEVEINVPNRKMIVRDNGVGIAGDDLDAILLPRQSRKRIAVDYGFKGLGLTFVAFVSKTFRITSRHLASDQAYSYRFDGAFGWLADDASAAGPAGDADAKPAGKKGDGKKAEAGAPAPAAAAGAAPFPDSPEAPEPDELEALWSTVVEIGLDDHYADRFGAAAQLDRLMELCDEPTDIERLLYILRSHTALGNTRFLFGDKPVVPIKAQVRVTLASDPTAPLIRDVPYEYYQPAEHEELAVEHYDFGEYVKQLVKTTFDPYFRSLTHTMPGQTVGTRPPLKFDAYLTAASSTRMSNIDGALGLTKLEDSSLKVDYGVYLAISGMPTGIRIDDWDQRGHQYKRIHVVVDCDLTMSNQLDPGRKGISNYFAGLVNDKVRELLGTSIDNSESFMTYAARYLNIGRGSGVFEPSDFQAAIKDAREYQAQDAKSSNELVELVRKISPLEALPHTEQEVIVLFNSLLDRGLIKGYRTVYVGGASFVYDAGYEYDLDLTDQNLAPKDPIGFSASMANDLKKLGNKRYVHKDHYTTRTAMAELCVEFKKTIGGFLKEIDRQTSKDPNVINILVVWDTDVQPGVASYTYTIPPVQDTKRLYHGTTHRLGIAGPANTELFVISLKDVLLALKAKGII